jgi:hypothetical protein
LLVVGLVFVLFFVIVFWFFFVEDFDGGVWFCEVESFWGWGYGADYVGGVGLGAEFGRVDGGELEAVEEGGGAAGFELAQGEGVDDDREGGLDGLAIF